MDGLPMKYHYTGCGLDYIYLLNGFERHDTAYGQGVSLGDIDVLHDVIALDIIARPQKIRGQELRFIRTMLDLSQDGLAAFLGVDRATIADWEKERGQAIDAGADRALRFFYALKVEKHDLATKLIDLMNHIDDLKFEADYVADSQASWTLAA